MLLDGCIVKVQLSQSSQLQECTLGLPACRQDGCGRVHKLKYNMTWIECILAHVLSCHGRPPARVQKSVSNTLVAPRWPSRSGPHHH